MHIDIFFVIAIAVVLLLVLRFSAKMLVKSLKWALYIGIVVAAGIYVLVRTH